MSRIVRDWTPEKVADATIAPHRYTWAVAGPEPVADPADGILGELRAWQRTVPYRAGDVVYVARNGVPALARILIVFCERTRSGDRIAKFRVQFATSAGNWSKVWSYTWPGFIQRGYQLAGLAPDVPT